MSNGITRDEMRDLFEQYFKKGSGADSSRSGPDSANGDPKTYNELIKKIKETTESLKKQIPANDKLSRLLNGQRQQYIDSRKELEEFDKQLNELTVTAKDQADLNKKLAEKKVLQEKRDTAATAISQANARAAVANFSMTVGTVAQTLLKGAFQYAKDLQSGASGVEAGSNAAMTAATATGEAISGFGSLLQGIGLAIGAVFKKLPFIGPALAVAGVGLEVFGKKASDVSKEGLDFLSKELKNTQVAFKSIHETGAVFGGGMTELRNVAASAGLDVGQLAAVVSKSKDDLVGMGLGIGEATKRIAGISKELRTSEIGTQLRKLGYSTEEQALLAASVSARMSAAGDIRVRSDANVARMTAQYGKDLKILSDITGKDAKAAMEKARLQAQEQDLLVEAMAKGGPEAVKKLEAQLASMPETMKKGYMEFVSTGGTAIADAATNVAISQNPKIMQQYKNMYVDLGNAQVNASAALERTLTANEETAKYAKDNAAATKDVALAARFGSNAILQGSTAIQNELIVTAGKQKEGATKAAVKAAEEAAKNTAPLDVAVAKVEEDAQKLRSAMGDELTPAVTKFAEGLATATTTVSDALEKLGVKTKEVGTGEKVGEAGGALAGALGGAKAGAALGSLLGPIGTMVGGAIGAAAGGYAGSKAGEYAGKKADETGFTKTVSSAVGSVTDTISGWFSSKPGKATGGIAEGPTSGYLEKLHGIEAVVPLEGGRDIPVTINGGEMFSNLKLGLNEINSSISSLIKNENPNKVLFNNPTNLIKSSGLLAEFNNIRNQITQQTSVTKSAKLNNNSIFSNTLLEGFNTISGQISQLKDSSNLISAGDFKSIENSIASIPESMKKGYVDIVSTSKTAIADIATNVNTIQNPKIMQQYKDLTQNYNVFGKFKSNLKNASAAGITEKKYQQISSADIENESVAKIDFSNITDTLKNMVSSIVSPDINSMKSLLKTNEPVTTKTIVEPNIKTSIESDLSKALREQMMVLREIKDTLSSSRDLQQQFVYNTYS